MWDWIVNILFELLKLIQTFAVDWGLSIIILVVIIRLLLTPLMLKSTKSTARMQVLQPKMLEIQERYADDPQRQAEEMQKFYSENKFNPMAGCLPLLIQMPILFALFTLLRNLPQYFNDGTFSFFNILPDLTTTPSASFADGFMVALPALVCLILFAVLTLIPQLYMSRNQTGQQAQIFCVGLIRRDAAFLQKIGQRAHAVGRADRAGHIGQNGCHGADEQHAAVTEIAEQAEQRVQGRLRAAVIQKLNSGHAAHPTPASGCHRRRDKSGCAPSAPHACRRRRARPHAVR